ncbi:hypothetical protein BpHYR1_049308 [Brachionus plicatilis]|uniref:Uncharacterized protein n=1 Tax=Brachionus plicatilis TaxID=10195 RepID=A0A3M7PYB3_BRAPC|nr:hypothetical protein BpHYR1_049308 [Brachionus plicatilis]
MFVLEQKSSLCYKICKRGSEELVEDHIVWLPPPSSFLIQGLGPAYGRVMVAYNINFCLSCFLINLFFEKYSSFEKDRSFANGRSKKGRSFIKS